MADSQRNAAYAWEASFKDWNRKTSSQKVLRWIIRDAEDAYGIRPVKSIRFPRRDRGSIKDLRSGKGRRLDTCYDPEAHTVTIRPRHMNLAVALHEVSHAIHDDIFGGAAGEAHGPIWLGIYMWLLREYGIAPESALVASAKAAKLVWTPFKVAAPRRIRIEFDRLITAMKK